MNALTSLDNKLTMSSREIAELTGKRHDNVLADIRTMLEQLGEDLLTFQEMSSDSYGRQQKVFALPKDLTITLVAGYSIVLRHRITKRWLELEQQAQPAVQVPTTLVEALRLAADKATFTVTKPQESAVAALPGDYLTALKARVAAEE